ncbi:aminotransferase class IV, partial [Streptomyces sp. NPDC048845]|uniref:aminotransferase class IV n=1 Tax=Streptomyces sp. NPDC048845 TaxID=3155390 RepID=UPI003433FFE4
AKASSSGDETAGFPAAAAVDDGALYTPPLASGCLAGITRALVAEWAGAEEAELPLDVLDRADEVFLTSTLRDVQGVHAIDGRLLPGAPGPVTAKARRIFTERAAADPDPRPAGRPAPGAGETG